MLQLRVIVIGAGIVGASAAYHLAKINNDVMLIDVMKNGQATAAGAGIICPWTSLERGEQWYNMANEAAHFYPQLIKELSEYGEKNVSYKKVGSLVTATNSDHLQKHWQLIKNRQAKAPLIGQVEHLTNEGAKKYFPLLDEQLEALYIPGAARVDGRLLTKALLNIAEQNGVDSVQGEASLRIENDQVIGVQVQDEIYEADRILLTAGAWVTDLLKPFNLTIHIEPQRGQIVHLTLPQTKTSHWPVISPVGSGHYLVPFENSRIVIGATRETNSGFDYRMTADGVREVLNEGLTVAPGLTDATLTEVRIGFRPMSQDLLPLIGKIPSIDNLYLANGLGPSGLTIGPFVGKLISEMIYGKASSIDLTPYAPERAIS